MALTLQQKLDQAEAAYHDLMIGQSARVVVDQNSERVEFTAANASKLLQYINELKAQLGTLSTSRQPLRPFF
jgi:predicted regulator of Ras-like GTPase activity (Roadblock/LC7/MglB family)